MVLMDPKRYSAPDRFAANRMKERHTMAPDYDSLHTSRVKTTHYAQDKDTSFDVVAHFENKGKPDKTYDHTHHSCSCHGKQLLSPSVKRHLPLMGPDPPYVVNDCKNKKWVVCNWVKDHRELSCETEKRRRWFKGGCVKCCMPPEELLPLLPHAEKRYPYRYSSAGPSRCNGTQKEKELEKALFVVSGSSFSIKKQQSNTGFMESLNHIHANPGWKTTTLEDSLLPYMSRDKLAVFRCPLHPHGRGEPLLVNRAAHTQFGQFISDSLHPQWPWKKNPLLNRRYDYRITRRQ